MPQSPFAVTIARNTAGSQAQPQLDKQGAIPVAALHGTFYEAALAARLFMGSSQTAVTLSAALATTYVGLCLSNPSGSAVNLSLLRVAGLFNVAPSALTAFGLIIGASPITVHTTPVTPVNAKLGGTASVGLLDAACTLVAPSWGRWFTVNSGATAQASFDSLVDGGLMIPPGTYVAVGAQIAGPTNGFLGSMLWEEAPV